MRIDLVGAKPRRQMRVLSAAMEIFFAGVAESDIWIRASFCSCRPVLKGCALRARQSSSLLVSHTASSGERRRKNEEPYLVTCGVAPSPCATATDDGAHSSQSRATIASSTKWLRFWNESLPRPRSRGGARAMASSSHLKSLSSWAWISASHCCCFQEVSRD